MDNFRTCEPSIPSQTKVLWGNLLIKFHDNFWVKKNSIPKKWKLRMRIFWFSSSFTAISFNFHFSFSCSFFFLFLFFSFSFSLPDPLIIWGNWALYPKVSGSQNSVHFAPNSLSKNLWPKRNWRTKDSPEGMLPKEKEKEKTKEGRRKEGRSGEKWTFNVWATRTIHFNHVPPVGMNFPLLTCSLSCWKHSGYCSFNHANCCKKVIYNKKGCDLILADIFSEIVTWAWDAVNLYFGKYFIRVIWVLQLLATFLLVSL